MNNIFRFLSRMAKHFEMFSTAFDNRKLYKWCRRFDSFYHAETITTTTAQKIKISELQWCQKCQFYVK